MGISYGNQPYCYGATLCWYHRELLKTLPSRVPMQALHAHWSCKIWDPHPIIQNSNWQESHKLDFIVYYIFLWIVLMSVPFVLFHFRLWFVLCLPLCLFYGYTFNTWSTKSHVHISIFWKFEVNHSFSPYLNTFQIIDFNSFSNVWRDLLKL